MTLAILQFPFCDLRPFVAPQARLLRPHWPTPDAGSEFVRFFGQVRERGADEQFSRDELVFCRAKNALKLPNFSHRHDWAIAFRRLLSDGRSISRFEVGIKILRKMRTRGEVLRLLGGILDSPCVVRGERRGRAVLSAGEGVAKLYAAATHRGSEPIDATDVVCGRPCLLLEYDPVETSELPMSIDYQRPGQGLAFARLTHHGIALNTWYVSTRASRSRMLRLTLLRLHAEHQALKYVVRAIEEGRIALDRGTPTSDAAQSFLSDTMRLLAQGERNGVAQKDLVETVHTYEELCAADEVALLQQRLGSIRRQVRLSVEREVDRSLMSTPPPEDRVGPAFDWQGPIDELAHHSFFKPVAPYIPVRWVSDVVKRLCPAVCLISLPARRRTATGFLVKKDLLLTNYHVVAGEFEEEDVAANLADMELTFELSSTPHRVFRLDPMATPVRFSGVSALDFALLRTAEDVQAALQLDVITYDGSAMPERGRGIHILQHPQGEPLKISGDADGVAGVFPEMSKVQYVSRAEPGSSGGPCFDDDLRLVAIHRCERRTKFGSVREGVLMEKVHQSIQSFTGGGR
jgi:hypothetical protein